MPNNKLLVKEFYLGVVTWKGLEKEIDWATFVAKKNRN